MPDELPESPASVADLLSHLPLPYSYAVRWGLVFNAALADRLAEVQAEKLLGAILKNVELRSQADTHE